MSRGKGKEKQKIPLTTIQRMFLEHLYCEHFARLVALAKRSCRNESDAWDAVQSVMLKIARDPGRIARSRRLSAYLDAMLRKSVFDLYRRTADFTSLEEAELEQGLGYSPQTENHLGYQFIEEAFAHELSRFSKSQASAIRGIIFEGSTLRDAAIREGIPERTLKRSKRKFLALLKEFARLDCSTEFRPIRNNLSSVIPQIELSVRPAQQVCPRRHDFA